MLVLIDPKLTALDGFDSTLAYRKMACLMRTYFYLGSRFIRHYFARTVNIISIFKVEPKTGDRMRELIERALVLKVPARGVLVVPEKRFYWPCKFRLVTEVRQVCEVIVPKLIVNGGLGVGSKKIG